MIALGARWRLRSAALILCFSTRVPAQAATAYDSASIRIVLNQPPAPNRVFRVPDAPLLQIGSESSTEYSFNGIVTATRLRDGRYDIADNGSGQIRIFNREGRIVRTLGRSGAGPGEFINLLWVWQHLGDSIRAWDTRLSTFPLNSNAVRTAILRTRDGSTGRAAGVVRGMLADGSFFVYETRPVSVQQAERALRDTAIVWRVSAEGVPAARVGMFLFREVRRSAAGYSMATPGSATQRPVMIWRGQPFAFSTQLAASATGLIATNSFGAFEWQERSPNGVLRRISRVSRPRIRVTPEVIRAQQAEEHVSNSNFALAQPPLARNLPASEYPTHIPAYSAMRVDTENRIWVRLTSVLGTAPERWDVFRADGTLIDVVELPARFAFFDAGSDFVMGVWRDDDDVEYVRVYRLALRR